MATPCGAHPGALRSPTAAQDSSNSEDFAGRFSIPVSSTWENQYSRQDEMLLRTTSMFSDQSHQTCCAQPPNWGRVGMKIVAMVAGFAVIVIALEEFASDEVQRVSTRVMDVLGLPGLFITVFLLDSLPQPFTYVPLIFLAVKDGSASRRVVFAVCSTASYCAALTGYAVGRGMRTCSRGRALFRVLGEKHPEVPDLMARKGAIGVALAALLPLPLALATWTAGSFEVPLHLFALAGMCRMPKIAVFVALSSASVKHKV